MLPTKITVPPRRRQRSDAFSVGVADAVEHHVGVGGLGRLVEAVARVDHDRVGPSSVT